MSDNTSSIQRTSIIIGTITEIFVITGVIFGAFQYILYLQNEREKNALEFVREYQKLHISDARLWLLNHWIEHPLTALNNRSGSTEVIAAIALDHIFPEGKKPRINELFKVVGFLDTVASCYETDVCDRTIVDQHLVKDAQSLYCLYRAPIQKLRDEKSIKNFAATIERNFIDEKALCSRIEKSEKRAFKLK